MKSFEKSKCRLSELIGRQVCHAAVLVFQWLFWSSWQLVVGCFKVGYNSNINESLPLHFIQNFRLLPPIRTKSESLSFAFCAPLLSFNNLHRMFFLRHYYGHGGIRKTLEGILTVAEASRELLKVLYRSKYAREFSRH